MSDMRLSRDYGISLDTSIAHKPLVRSRHSNENCWLDRIEDAAGKLGFQQAYFPDSSNQTSLWKRSNHLIPNFPDEGTYIYSTLVLIENPDGLDPIRVYPVLRQEETPIEQSGQELLLSARKIFTAYGEEKSRPLITSLFRKPHLFKATSPGTTPDHYWAGTWAFGVLSGELKHVIDVTLQQALYQAVRAQTDMPLERFSQAIDQLPEADLANVRFRTSRYFDGELSLEDAIRTLPEVILALDKELLETN